MSKQQQYIAGDQIRPVNRTASTGADFDSSDPLRGSFLDQDGKRRRFRGSTLEVWTGSTWAADSIRVTDSREFTGDSREMRRQYLEALDAANREALERTGVDDEPEGSAPTASGADNRSEREKYLDALKRQNAESIK